MNLSLIPGMPARVQVWNIAQANMPRIFRVWCPCCRVCITDVVHSLELAIDQAHIHATDSHAED
jgi:hypothetical protein